MANSKYNTPMTTQSQSPFDTIRSMSADILLHSTDLLSIDPFVVSGALQQRLESFRAARSEDLHSYPVLTPQDELGLNLFFNTINFCFKDPTSGNEYQYTSRDGHHLKRTTAFITALAESGLAWNDLHQISALTIEEWTAMIQLGEQNPLYLGTERNERITGFARYLLDRGHATALGFIQANDFDCLKLLQVFIDSGYFKDDFLKRAQVALKMIDTLTLRRLDRGLNGMQALTCMADYRLPQVFYNLGAIVLSPALKERLTRQQPLISESREELALRASVIAIAEQLAGLMKISEAEVDTLLWETSQHMARVGEMTIPHMLVATDKY